MRELDVQIRSTKSQALLDGAQSIDKVSQSTFLSGPGGTGEAEDQGGEGGEGGELERMFHGTDLFKQLCSIEEMLGVKARNVLKVSGDDKSRPYLDIRDAQWSNSGTLKPIDATKLSPSNFVVYR